VEHPSLNIVNNRRLSIELHNDNTISNKDQAVYTPFLGESKKDYNSTRSNLAFKQDSYLSKYNKNSNYVPINHLYKFNAANMKKFENEQAKNQNSPPVVEDIRDIFIEGKNSDSTFWSKRTSHVTPLNSNLQNYIESFQFETPIAANGGKLMNSATPSSNVASITTATSMRKMDINSPLVGNKSSSESRNISLYNDSCKKQRYVHKGGTKNLMKQSLERIDNAIKRFSKNNGTNVQAGPFELTSNTRSQSQTRDYLNSQCSSLFGGHMQVGNDANSIIQPQAFSDSVTNTIV
jgi:hypothetical protein